MRKRLTKVKSGYVFKTGENEGQGECFRGLIPSKEERDGEKCMRQIRANRWHQWIETVELFGKCSLAGQLGIGKRKRLKLLQEHIFVLKKD